MAEISGWIDEYSRYQYAELYTDAEENLFCEEREPIEAPVDEDSYVMHMIAADDNLFSLSGFYYHGLVPRPARFWWAIMEVNGIIDPTIPLTQGTEIIIPDLNYILEWLGYRHDIMA